MRDILLIREDEDLNLPRRLRRLRRMEHRDPAISDGTSIPPWRPSDAALTRLWRWLR